MAGVLTLTTRASSGCRGNADHHSGGGTSKPKQATTAEEQNQLSLLALLISAIRKSLITCRLEDQDDVCSAVHHMDIGWPTNVQHIAHVTFDRFHGFLGLPVEFEVEVPSRAPSASISVFGVSAGSMQCSDDSRGNSVPTILLLMQERLYTQGGLKAEGIFRINPENSKEEHVRDQLNRGIVPDDIDVHCLAGLIKAWFRELPEGILDGLSPEQVLQCNSEEECVDLVKQLQPIPASLLNWAVDLMADVVEEEELNKMNPRNIAMVFAPNMTQMSDPLTALMHAVQVMNLLKTLIIRTLREREETSTGGYSPFSGTSSDRRTYEEYDSQQEMDMSCELMPTISEYAEHGNYSNSSGDEDEVESLNEIEECFLRQLHGNEDVTGNVDTPKESATNHASSPFSSPSSVHNTDDSGLSIKNKRLCLSTSSADKSVSFIGQDDSVATDVTIEKYVDVETIKEDVKSLPDFSSPSLL